MFFYTWMIKNHLKDDSAKGLLARSMKAEGNGFPKRRRLKTLVGYLEHRGASQEVMDEMCIRDSIGTALPIRTACASAWVTMTSTGRTARFSRPRRGYCICNWFW